MNMNAGDHAAAFRRELCKRRAETGIRRTGIECIQLLREILRIDAQADRAAVFAGEIAVAHEL